MNKLFIIIAFVICTSFSSSSQAYDIKQAAVCQYIAQDKNSLLHRALVSTRSSINSVYKWVKCDGMNIVEYAKSEHSENVVQYFIKKLSYKNSSEKKDLIAYLSEAHQFANN